MLVTLLLLAALIPAVQPQSRPQSLSPSQLVYTGTPDRPLQLNIQDGAVQPLLTALTSNVLGGRPVSSLDEALALPGLLNLLPGSALSINQTSIVTSCNNLLSIQAVACQLPWNSLGNLKVSPGSLWIPSWRSTSLSLRDVSVTCLSPPSWIAAARNYSGSFPGNYTVPRGSLVQPYTGQPPTPLLACAVQPVSTWTELVNTTVHLQLYALTVYIVIRANITVPYNYSSSVSGTVAVYRNLHISPDPGIARNKTVLDLGYVRGEGPIDKYPMSVLPWGFWHVDFDRCREYNGIMVALNCTLILQASTMQYISYWAGELLSPFSDHRTAAAWYGIDPTCNPPQNRTLLNQQIELVEQYTWVAQNATNLGTTLSNCLLTTRYPEGVATTLPGLPLTLLLEDPYTPFTTISWVNNATGLIQVLMTQPTQNIILLGNISISPGLWPLSGIALKRDLVIAGWPTRDTVLDWQGASSCLLLGTHQLRLRNLVLQNGGQCRALAAGGPDGGSEGGGGSGCDCWNANLTLYQWPLVLQR
ncbi:hypothetical protein HaLaN_21285 [Haematococcus lacustris]|uniref:Protein kinase domain-containing protein n=1 Tax=Haematococcus lacustris TaxID=44745 RepID=A0A6A0A2K0_HAELA|nr:hypothetical protein HaLaN_21285 [Haematococcus lacustris]